MSTRIEPRIEFLDWFDGLTEAEQDAVDRYITLLRERGVTLPHPYCSAIRGAEAVALRELRPTAGQSELRVFYAFDAQRDAVVLIGGCKTGANQKKFYEQHIKLSEEIWHRHCADLAKKKEKSNEGSMGNRTEKASKSKKNRRK